MRIDRLRPRVYGLLALGFRRVTPQHLEVLAGQGTRRVLSGAAELLPGSVLEGWDRHLRRFSQEVAARGSAALARELLTEYCRLFLGPEGLLCPPYGSVYLDGGAVMGPSTLDALRRYRNEGLKPTSSWREPPDHVCLELAFLACLSEKYSRAVTAMEHAEARRLLLVQREFLRDHLGRWAPRFAERLRQTASSQLYLFLGAFLPMWLSFDEELLRAEMAAEQEVKAGCR